MRKTLATLILISSISLSLSAVAAEPSLHEVYQAVDAGRLNEAQHMMTEVLRSHPNSGKAHFVEAEILSRQGKLNEAASELALAEEHAPGLPFAKPESVASLRAALRQHPAEHNSPISSSQLSHSTASTGGNSFPWGLLLLGGGVIAFIFWASKFMQARQAAGGNRIAAPSPTAPYGAPDYRSPQAATPYGAPNAWGNTPAAANSGPGMGSQIMSGLATGAAIGAGVVAGEALMHHFTDRPKSDEGSLPLHSRDDTIPSLPASPIDSSNDTDFGIADNNSWDDGGQDDSDWT